MLVYHSPRQQQHRPTSQYFNSELVPHPDVPARAEALLSACRQLGWRMLPVNHSASFAELATVHDSDYIAYLQHAPPEAPLPGATSNFAPDTFTPIDHYTASAASYAAKVALQAARALLEGEINTYAICRPPGHHAGRRTMAGFCYYNNAALAARALAKHGKVAILDIDYHHGNGTQEIFYTSDQVLYASLHADPAYEFPHSTGYADERGSGVGLGHNYNYPLPKHTTATNYVAALQQAVGQINEYSPRFLVVSLGFDTYAADPIAGFALHERDYRAIGASIGHGLNCPTVFVQEGGYNVAALPALASEFFGGYLAERSSS